MKDWWHRFLFAWRDADSLNLFRALFCLNLTYRTLHFALNIETNYARMNWYAIPTFEWLGLGMLPETAAKWVAGITIAAILFAALGLWTRLSLTIGWIGYYLFIGTMLSFTKLPDSNYVYHSENIAVFVLLVLSISPAIDRWGLSAWWANRRQWKPHPGRGDLIHQWPYQTIKALLVIAYFGAGWCKVVEVGFLWADGYSMQGFLLEKFLLHDNSIGLWLAHYYWLCLILGILTLILELTFPIILFYPRLSWIYLTMGFSLHLGIYFAMSISFFKVFVTVYLIFLNLPKIYQFLGKTWHQPGKREQGGVQLGRWVFSVVAVVMTACVFFRVEAWPFTDYRVFTYRSSAEQITVLRIAGEDALGRQTWLTQEELANQKTALNKRLRKPVMGKDSEGVVAILDKVASNLPQASRSRYRKLAVVMRKIQKNNRGNFVALDAVILRYDL